LDDDFTRPAVLEAGYWAAEKAVQLDSNLPQARYQLGLSLSFKGQIEAAVAECERAVALNPSLRYAELRAVFKKRALFNHLANHWPLLLAQRSVDFCVLVTERGTVQLFLRVIFTGHVRVSLRRS
jgi:tetratricopeptide (TPR) repeat protein